MQFLQLMDTSYDIGNDRTPSIEGLLNYRKLLQIERGV